MKYTWEYGENQNVWKHNIFDSVEDCITDAKKNYNVEPGEVIGVWEVYSCNIHVSARRVLSDVQWNIISEFGEVAEHYSLYNVKLSKDKDSDLYKKINELSEDLTKIVEQWIKKNGNYPNFYNFKNVKAVEVK